jgi:hypothetical protein
MQIRCSISWLAFLLLLAISGNQTEAIGVEGQPVTYYVQLIRGTGQEHRQEATWKPVGPKLANRLSPIFRWKNYWEVTCQAISVEKGKVSRCHLSDVRDVEIALINPLEIEIKLYLKGAVIEKSRQLVRTHMAIMGGDRTKDESWFVVVRREKPQYP